VEDKNAKDGFSFRPCIKIYDSIGNPDNKLKRLRSSINNIGQVKSKSNSYYLLIEKEEEQVELLNLLNFNVSSLLVPNLKQRINLVLKILKRKKIKNLSPEEYIQMGEWADKLNILDLISIPIARQRKQIIAERTKNYFKSENTCIAKKMKDYFKSENTT
jgi:hypothetical protein